MFGPAFRHLALGELDDDDLRAMLREGETLFVEFKKDVAKGTGFQVAKAAASFANTLGGWVLVGVQDGQLRSDWSPRPAILSTLSVSASRAMSTRCRPLRRSRGARREKIGVVRAYESADTRTS